MSLVYRFIPFLLLAFVVASCGGGIEIDETEWCYTYSFTVDDQGFSIATGSQVVGEGLVSDSTGLLQFSYEHTTFVQPYYVIITAIRPSGVTGDITATAAGNVFAVSSSFTETLPSMLNDADLVFENEIGPETPYSKTVNITVDADQPIGIASIEIRGSGALPFPVNMCADPTETPTGATSTAVNTQTPAPSLTPTSTDTPDPSITPTITPTPGAPWTCDFDFSDSNHSFYTAGSSSFGAPLYGQGVYVAANGWRYEDSGASGTQRRAVAITKALPSQTTITYVSFVYDYTQGTVLSGATTWGGLRFDETNIQTYNYPVSNGTFQTFSWSGSVIVSNTFGIGFRSSNGNYSGGGLIRFARVDGIGGVPPCTQITPTPTASPTFTPSVSPTRTPLPTVMGGTINPTFTNIPNPTQYMQTQTQAAIVITTSATVAPTSSATATLWATRTQYPTTTPFGLPTVGAGTPTLTTDEQMLEMQRELIDSSNGILDEIRFSAEGTWDLLRFIAALLRSIFEFIVAILGAILGLIVGLINLIIELLEIIWLIIQLIWGILSLIIAYMGQAFNIVSGILSGFFTADLVPIPGFPLCVTDPLSYDICAIYYIMDWTMFAPATPGAVIIPIALILPAIFNIITLVRSVLKLFRRGESVTNVS